MKKILLLLLILGCSQQVEVEGLWELHKVDVDMIPRGFKPTYLEIKKDGSFSVSKEDGDVIGLYKVKDNFLSLSSSDKDWFNRRWKVFSTSNELVLNDVKNDFRGAQLRFRRITKFPDFEEFQQALNGNWKLYKISENGVERNVYDTQFNISNEGYSIIVSDSVQEKGEVHIDARHQKINFQNEKMMWDVRFVWDDLRLENRKLNITYRLRKVE